MIESEIWENEDTRKEERSESRGGRRGREKNEKKKKSKVEKWDFFFPKKHIFSNNFVS